MWQQQLLLMLVTNLHVGLIPVVAILFFLNPIVITGVDGWVKPLKLAISGAIYAASIAWIANLLATTSRWYKLATGTIALALIIETASITMQVVRGTTSHYNISTPSIPAFIRSWPHLSACWLQLLSSVCWWWPAKKPSPPSPGLPVVGAWQSLLWA